MEQFNNEILNNFETISLKNIDRISLPNRIDTKFVFHISHLNQILTELSKVYKILVLNDERVQTYSTYYFDTPKKDLYFHHHQGRANRYKIRVRRYHTTRDVFFELKTKSNKSITRKKRIRIEPDTNAAEKLPELLQKVGLQNNMDLDFSISNSFNRISLANVENTERATIDFDLSFEKNNENISLPFLVICEIKTNKKYSNSVLYKVLKKNKIYPMRISKYIVGNILFDKNLKHNRFKEKMIILNKIKNEYIT